MAARKSRQATRGKHGKPLPAWVWMAVGMVFGVVLMLVVVGKDWTGVFNRKAMPRPDPQATAPGETDPPLVPATTADTKPKRPTYDFYQVLPEKEVVIPDAELSARARAEQAAKTAQAQKPTSASTPTTTPPASTGTSRYMLQAGSFPDSKSADEVKAKLALLGFSAQVQTVNVDGKTWNRVRMGPYPTASDLEVAKRTLTDNGVKVIAMKETQ
ncbi:MAG: SPOR domain-containing protein [Dokdonella sp.]